MTCNFERNMGENIGIDVIFHDLNIQMTSNLDLMEKFTIDMSSLENEI